MPYISKNLAYLNTKRNLLFNVLYPYGVSITSSGAIAAPMLLGSFMP